MPQLLDRLSHKPRKCQLLLHDQLLESPKDPVPTTVIEMTTAIGRTINTAAKTTGVTTTTVAITTIAEGMIMAEGTIIAAGTTIATTTITVATRNTIGRMIIIGTIITTADNRATTKGTTDRKMYAKSDKAHRTTIREGPTPQGLNHRVRMSIKNGNWYQ